MKKYSYRLPVKLIGFFLAALSLFATVVSAFSLALLLYGDGYHGSEEELREEYLSDRFGFLTDHVVYLFQEGYYFKSNLEELQKSIPFTCILISEGKVLYDDTTSKEPISVISEVVTAGSDSNPYVGKDYLVQIFLQTPPPGSDLEAELFLLETLYHARIPLIPVFLVSAVLSVLLCVFLCCSAGRCGDGEPKTGFFDRIPLEICLGCGVLLILLEIAVLDGVASLQTVLICLGIFLLVDLVLFLLLLMTLAVRIKTGTVGASSFCGKLWRAVKASRKWLVRLWEDARLTPKVVLIMAALALFDLILASMLDFTECLAAFFIEGIVLSGFLIWYAAAICRLEKDLEKIAEGKLDTCCDLTRLPPGLRSFGEKMNRSARGLEAAVEEKLRSERFKTELITNVSHDIKTPLTSIVNYVDLMKKEEIESETLKEYLEVLDRQSKRLKKLTEDLVESSKAASGALSVKLEPCDARVLLEQALGEHQAALEEAGLKPQLSLPEESVFILADGKRLWRVMDNLFQNIKKYALTGTRVYVSLETRGDKVDLVFRNISAEPIAVSGEELTERFVRGDASRNSEGSGLGLSIARSLTQLQNGELTLTVDGDLFKAVITFERHHP